MQQIPDAALRDSVERDGKVREAKPESHSNFCPVCSEKLESHRCKLVCAVCGYYMSCSDYY